MASRSGQGLLDPRESADRPPVVVVITDTLRSDMLRDETILGRLPVLQTLIEESYVFDRAYAASHWTLPSHGTLFTGLLPSDHGAVPPRMLLRSDVPTLAEVFRAEGYRTGLASCNAFLSPMFGMTRGFDRVWDSPPSLTTLLLWMVDGYLPPSRGLAQLRGGVRDLADAGLRLVASTPRSDNGAKGAVDFATAFLADSRTPPFLVLNFMEAHAPYHARGAFRGLKSRMRYLDAMGSWADYVFSVMGGRTKPTADDFRAIQRLYWENVAYLDARIGDLLRLDGGFWDRAYLVLVSDHGQMLGEKGELDHVTGLWEPLLRVPLLIRPPGGVRAERTDDPVSLAALFSLLSEIANGTENPVNRWRDRQADRQAIFAESQRGIVPYLHPLTHGPASRSQEMRRSLLTFSAEQDHPALACIRGPWKLVCHLGRKEDELYDVVNDPNEEVNRVSQQVEVVDALHDQLRRQYLQPRLAEDAQQSAPRRDSLPMQAKVNVAEGVLRAAFSLDRQAVLLWTGGKDSTLVLYLALDLVRRGEIPLPRTVVVDHGQHFPETWTFLREVAAKEGLTLDVARNDALMRAARDSAGTVPLARLDAEDQEEALIAGFQGDLVPLSLDTQVGNHLLKTVALNRYLLRHHIDTVVTGIRWDENPARSTEVFFSPREKPPHTRAHPILPWSERDVWAYTLGNGLPHHPLYRVGYRSLDGIYDSKPTDVRPAWEQDLDGTPERAGRAQDKEHIMARLRSMGYF